MKVLLTNDDGIEAEGLQALRRELASLPGVELEVIAPDGNRSAMARMITTHRPLWLEEVPFEDGSVGYATDGTPVDCVRFAQLGVIDGFVPELIVSGINHGSNLGDDVTYSGTVAAALEGIVLGIPAVAVSQQSTLREMDFRMGRHFDFEAGARFTAGLVDGIGRIPLPEGTLLNVNVPGGEPLGVVATSLGTRIYRDHLTLEHDAGDGRRRYLIYGADHGFEDEAGTDLAAVAEGMISVTPLHFDLTYVDGIQQLSDSELGRLLRPAAPESG